MKIHNGIIYWIYFLNCCTTCVIILIKQTDEAEMQYRNVLNTFQPVGKMVFDNYIIPILLTIETKVILCIDNAIDIV